MARINFEDSVWKAAGFQELMIKIGDRHKAMGMVLDLWALAQEHWFPNMNPIPRKDFEAHGLSPLLEVRGLVEERVDGIYACGSKDAFAWLFQRQEAGRKGGEAKAQRSLAAANQPLADAKQNVASSSISISVSSSSSDSDSVSKEEQAVVAPATPPKGQAFMAAYVEAWKRKYKTSPVLEDAELGVLKRLAKGAIPTQTLVDMAFAFLAMNDSWFLTKRHDLVTFEKNLKAVKIYMDTGVAPTKTEIHQADKAQTTANAFDAIRAERRSHGKR